MRLFCFPYAGGGTSAFRGWSELLGDELEVWPVQLPGRENRLREGLFDSIHALIPHMASALGDLLDRPFAFYGHSLGGTIAFETARWLRRISRVEPSHLFVGASPAPQLPWVHPPLRTLAEEELLREVEKRYGGVPRQVIEDAEMRALVLPILRADVSMVETYVYTNDAPLGCGITAVGGRHDSMVTKNDLQGWAVQTTESFRTLTLEGNHLFLQTHKQELLELISAELLALRKRQGTSAQGISSLF